MDSFEVSIVVITYGHEKFIGEALNGILAQNFSGLVEVVISNDHSPDKTDKVCKDFISRSDIPANIIFKYTCHDSNIGSMQNFMWALKQCNGKYIAICDGDDYWTDPGKLQRQVNYLNLNRNCAIHSSKAQTLNHNGKGEIIGDPSFKAKYYFSDFFTKNNLVTCTVMFRNHYIDNSVFEGVSFGDWMLYAYLLSKGSNSYAFVSDHVVAAYRVHSDGVMDTLRKTNGLAEKHAIHLYHLYSNFKISYSEDDIQNLNMYFIESIKLAFKNKFFKKVVYLNLLYLKIEPIRALCTKLKTSFKF
ncbi:glycosyltransferase family 2 protein [Sphingobacterium griseoflavum]|uniref:Glycosyltransferase 2-like domain-containing protein n=1 Tax=Sphingobacterium griseoflavum TaxID=1474952 RepID=A0ABQ3HYD0_9SPHI|nr:glycosyltransferase [Sphingobacterium griseoflavum]GHE39734.1 hypothetical protein GCM10017764_23790 [Sphingobacterium griseoflavum]